MIASIEGYITKRNSLLLIGEVTARATIEWYGEVISKRLTRAVVKKILRQPLDYYRLLYPFYYLSGVECLDKG